MTFPKPQLRNSESPSQEAPALGLELPATPLPSEPVEEFAKAPI